MNSQFRRPGRDSRLEDAARKLDLKLAEAERRIEGEVERIVKHLDDEVVPRVRGRSIQTLRTLSAKLAKLADYMDRQRGS